MIQSNQTIFLVDDDSASGARLKCRDEIFCRGECFYEAIGGNQPMPTAWAVVAVSCWRMLPETERKR
jgi:hypothetical protein